MVLHVHVKLFYYCYFIIAIAHTTPHCYGVADAVVCVGVVIVNSGMFFCVVYAVCVIASFDVVTSRIERCYLNVKQEKRFGKCFKLLN